MPVEPIRALIPLPEEKSGLLARLIDGLDQAALHWLSGYTAGLATLAVAPVRETVPLTAVEAQNQTQLTIVFGSQTGNAKRLAEALARDVESAGLTVRVVRERLVILVAEDNLVRGASGVAVQNFNLMFGLDEKTALL